MWVGEYELWESLRPSVGARSSVSHQAATIETLDMPMFILVPAEVLRALSHRLLESAIKLQMRAILGTCRIVWSNFGGILLFGPKGQTGLIFY